MSKSVHSLCKLPRNLCESASYLILGLHSSGQSADVLPGISGSLSSSFRDEDPSFPPTTGTSDAVILHHPEHPSHSWTWDSTASHRCVCMDTIPASHTLLLCAELFLLLTSMYHIRDWPCHTFHTFRLFLICLPSCRTVGLMLQQIAVISSQTHCP